MTPNLNRNEVEKPSPTSQALLRPPAMAIAPTRAEPRWRVSLSQYDGVRCVLRSKFWVLSLSLSMEESRSTFGVMVGIWAKFLEIAKGEWSHHQSLGFSKV